MLENNNKKKKHMIKQGAPMPLFDRLIDLDPDQQDEDTVSTVLSFEELEESIARELANIFDSRIGSDVDLPTGKVTPESLLPEQFGIRDFAGMFTQSDSGKREISSHVREAILRFEPRLLNPKVQMVSAAKDRFDVELAISGEIQIDDTRRPLSFPMVINNIL